MRLIEPVVWGIMTIWQEARNQGFDGMTAVAEVIRNRMHRRYSSDGTVEGTVLRPLQFSGWNTKDPNRLPSVRLDWNDLRVRECEKAWLRATGGSDLTSGAVLYCNIEHLRAIGQVPGWVAAVRQVAVIGDHTFYRPRGKGWD